MKMKVQLKLSVSRMELLAISAAPFLKELPQNTNTSDPFAINDNKNMTKVTAKVSKIAGNTLAT